MRTQYVIDSGSADAISITLTPAPTAWATPLAFFVKMAATNSYPAVTCAITGLTGTKPVVRRDNTPLYPQDLKINGVYLMAYDGTSLRVLSFVSSDLPQVPLTAAMDIYVNDSIGSDTTYDGTSASVNGTHGPFKTIQKALDRSTQFNLNGFNITIHVADGTYTSAALDMPPINGSGEVWVVGNTTTPSNCNVVSTAGNAFNIGYSGSQGTYIIEGFKVTANGTHITGHNGSAVACFGGMCWIANMRFSTCYGYHLEAVSGGRIGVNDGNIIIEGNPAIAHICAATGGSVFSPNPPYQPTLDIPNSVTATQYILTWANGNVGVTYDSIGNKTNFHGLKYHAELNSVIDTRGGETAKGADYYPGDQAGTTTTGGQYI